ncbi:MAG: glycosyltransferase family 4 protein [Actinomycetota bacterium]
MDSSNRPQPGPPDDRVRPLLLGKEWPSQVPGGLNRYFSYLFTTLRSQGVPAEAVVVGPGQGVPAGVTTAARTDQPLPVRVLRFKRAAEQAGAGANLVDAHFALYAAVPVIAGKLRRLPLVVHFQGPWAQESRTATNAPAWQISAKRALERSLYTRAEQLITLTGAFKRVLIEGYGVKPWRISVVPPGIDLERFKPGDRAQARAELQVPAEAKVGLSVRRLVPRMGLEVLLRAWAEVAAWQPDARLLLAGDGPLRSELQQLAGDLGIGDRVRFLGKVSDEALIDCYRAADVSVVPTVDLEGFGLVVLEALACATPVIATDAGGLPEVLAPFDKSLLVPKDDAPALAARLRTLLDGTAPGPTGPQCRRYAEQFGWDLAARRNLEVYARALHPHDDKLRVVFLDHCAELSGGELAMLRLLPALEGVDPHVILAEDGPLAAKLTQAGISVEVLAMSEAGRGLRRDRLKARRLPFAAVAATAVYTLKMAYRLRRLEPDLVHTNSLKSGIYGTAAARLAGVPSVWHVRDRIDKDYLPAGAVRLVRALARRLPSAIVANSQTTLATLRLDQRRPCAVIPSPVAQGTRRQPKDAQTFRVGMVGRLSPWKGQHLFLRAFAAAFPDGQAEAVVVGSALFGEQDYAKELADLASGLGISDRLDMRGFREDLAAELSRLDILVHASTIPEPFGQVVVEGMAAGLPVVAANAGGPAEIIEDAVNGRLYPMGDIQALSEVLQQLHRQPDLCRHLGEAARNAASEFTPQAVAPLVTRLYRELLGQPGGDRAR